MVKKLEYEYVKQYFEEHGCTLLETEYIDSHTHMNYICECKTKSITTWADFKQGSRCRQCGINRTVASQKPPYDDVRAYYESRGCYLIEKKYINNSIKMQYICQCGHIRAMAFAQFKKGMGDLCKSCTNEKRTMNQALDYDYVKKYFKCQGCILLEQEYVNCDTKMTYRCHCGTEDKITFSKFKIGRRCKECKRRDRSAANSGENNPAWNPDREYTNNAKRLRKLCYSLLHRVLNYTGNKKMARTKEYLGYTPQDLRNHIELHDNWLQVESDNWHLDHIFPISAFVEHGITDPKIINALDNLQPLLAKDNLSKNDTYNKSDFYFYLASKGITLSAQNQSVAQALLGS